MRNPFRSKIGFALGGGGARGLAHIGVLKAMGESPHSIDCIAGTSAGAFIAALYAFGKDYKEIEKIFCSITLSRIAFFKWGSSGVMDGRRIAEIIHDTLGDVDIKDAQIPLAIVCCDLLSGNNVVFTEGPLGLLVQASSAFPGLFSPVKYNGMLLVDGFLTENVPVSAVRNNLGANFVVAVNLAGDTQRQIGNQSFGMKEVLSRSFDILVDKPWHANRFKTSYVLNLDISFMDRFKISQGDKAVSIGYTQTKIMLRKPMLYWSLKPVFVYLRSLQRSLYKFIKTIFRRPSFQLPFFNKELRKKQESLPEHDMILSVEETPQQKEAH